MGEGGEQIAQLELDAHACVVGLAVLIPADLTVEIGVQIDVSDVLHEGSTKR